MGQQLHTLWGQELTMELPAAAQHSCQHRRMRAQGSLVCSEVQPPEASLYLTWVGVLAYVRNWINLRA